MKAKLLKLIQACIDDKSMYTHTYHDNLARGTRNNYRGINETLNAVRTQYINFVEYKGRNIWGSCDFKYDADNYTNQIDCYNLVIGFGNEPQIHIGFKTIAEDKNEVIQVTGTRKNYFGRQVAATFEIGLVKYKYEYTLTCGSFSYPIEESVVKELFDSIKAKRIDIKKQAELDELSSRFSKYYITDES